MTTASWATLRRFSMVSAAFGLSWGIAGLSITAGVVLGKEWLLPACGVSLAALIVAFFSLRALERLKNTELVWWLATEPTSTAKV